MNVGMLQKVRAAILANASQFDMAAYIREDEPCGTTMCICGTTMCIAGWAVYAAGRDVRKVDHENHIEDVAQGLLGLTEVQRDALFYGMLWPEGYEGARIAARVIDQLIETGTVDWQAACDHISENAA